jgi:hypothetical protein
VPIPPTPLSSTWGCDSNWTKNNVSASKTGMVVLDFQATEFSVDLLEIEAARIKLAAEPVEHLLVFFVHS